jgi:hypothetical protein
MSVDWGSLLGVAISVVAFFSTKPMQERHPLAPWHNIGSAAYVIVINPTHDSVVVSVSAPEVDDATRKLGTVPPYEFAAMRLPYADTEVRLNVSGQIFVLPVYRPGVIQVEVQAPVELPSQKEKTVL